MLPITIDPWPEWEKSDAEADPVHAAVSDGPVIYGDEWWRKATGTERTSVLVGV